MSATVAQSKGRCLVCSGPRLESATVGRCQPSIVRNVKPSSFPILTPLGPKYLFNTIRFESSKQMINFKILLKGEKLSLEVCPINKSRGSYDG